MTEDDFLAMVADVRPRLHRYCTKMVGSVLDGEDLVQETLAHAFSKLATLRDEGSVESWLFRIAHNRTIDLLRRRQPNVQELSEEPLAHEGADTTLRVTEAMTAVVTELPPKERACVVLKDVLGYGLQDIAEIVDSTVGGVKAALHRGRGKLQGVEERRPRRRPLDPKVLGLVEAYVDRFTRRDWDAVRELLRADARLELVGWLELHGADAIAANYFTNYEKIPEWRFVVGTVDGESVAVQLRPTQGGLWEPFAALRFVFDGDRIALLRDYVHVDGILEGATVAIRDGGSNAPCSGDALRS